jgi:hypothetical protein
MQSQIEEIITLISQDAEPQQKSFKQFDFRKTKTLFRGKEILQKINLLENDIWETARDINNQPQRTKETYIQILNTVLEIKKHQKPENNKELIILLQQLKQQLQSMNTINLPSVSGELTINKKTFQSLPREIKDEVLADTNELEKTFNASCYRASIILCGRILETCLHRKHYNATQNDLLEKSPGIGLGKLIQKLREKNVIFPPGLTQQIHLINQVRVFSVHVKKETFIPTRAQAHAIILYTMDSIEQMF